MSKESEVINGTVTTHRISLNLDKRVLKSTKKYICKSETEIIRKVFIYGLGLEDDTREIEEYVLYLLKKDLGLKKRDNLTKRAEIILAEKIIERLEKRLKNGNLSLLEKTNIKNDINDLREVLDEKEIN